MKRIVFAALVVAVSAALLGCAPAMTSKKEAFPKMYDERPLAILVLPPMNETTAADAKEYYSTTLAEPLTLMGYYVFPIEVVTEILRNDGLSDTELLLTVPPRKFKEYFGADAVLFVKITKWNTSYYIIGGHMTVGVDFVLKSTTSGEVLWRYEGNVQVDTTARSQGGGLAGLLIQVFATAIQTAATDYVPIAKQANAMVISTVPYGKYHPAHGTDQDAKIIKQTKDRDQDQGQKLPITPPN
jgi:hypothetical protein